MERGIEGVHAWRAGSAVPAPHPGMAYRPDIDGLRAVAVVAVLLFHVGVPAFRGGYVGVDIFFVISGFLIAGIIARDLETGRFSLLRFYERRVRRIFPALFAMMAAVVLVGAFVLLPSDYRRLGASTLSTTLFLANVYFAGQSGYFNASAEEAPLLHTWSLAVEEQYYIVFPLLMMLVARNLRGRYGAILAPGAILSFAAGVVLLRTDPVSAFYLPTARAWEFLGGALLGVGAVPPIMRRAHRAVAGFAGLALIGWAVFGFSEMTRFPGENALFPVIGTMLLIHAGAGGGILSDLFARPVPVFIGRISYSLYLWHWPVIVFWKYRTDGDWQPWEQGFVVALSFVLAVLSWRFVEQPVRRMRPLGPPRAFRFAAGALSTGCLAGALLYLTHGIPARVSASVVALDAASESLPDLPHGCARIGPERGGRLCAIGAADGTPPGFLLWGDSHARALMPAFDRAGAGLGMAGRMASYPACPTLLGLDRLDQPPSHDCSAFNQQVLVTLRAMPSVRTVFLVSRWGLCANGPRTEGGRPCYLGRDARQPMSFANDRRLFLQGLEATVLTLKRMGKNVVLIGPIPEFRSSVPETLARATLFEEPLTLHLPLDRYLVRQRTVFDAFRALQARYGIDVIYPHRLLCRSGMCEMTLHGTPLYADDDHLSERGGELFTGVARHALIDNRAAEAQAMRAHVSTARRRDWLMALRGLAGAG